MRKSDFILHVIDEKYGEWIEMAGADAPDLKCHILASILAKTMDERDQYKEIMFDLKCDIERLKRCPK